MCCAFVSVAIYILGVLSVIACNSGTYVAGFYPLPCTVEKGKHAHFPHFLSFLKMKIFEMQPDDSLHIFSSYPNNKRN